MDNTNQYPDDDGFPPLHLAAIIVVSTILWAVGYGLYKVLT